MAECEHCGVTVHDLPFEELGLSVEEAADSLFERVDGVTYCRRVLLSRLGRGPG